ncbi:YybH family protein [Daejeonella oryzae]|uniref:YybH family protein n=1 Tax=Daejeonella oryzae TaxID=1122943 RepID=UPI00040B7902|nr:nuclear transport factor 2 family protein [Daejeonella oryzae]
MKKIGYAVLLLLISLSAVAQSQTSFASAEQQKIIKVLEDQRLSWNNGNLEEYMQGYWKSDSLVFIGQGGPKYGWQQTLDNYKKGYPDKKEMGFLTFNFQEIRMLNSEHAFVVGAWHLKREKDEPQGYFTLLMKKIKGQWKVVADHSS